MSDADSRKYIARRVRGHDYDRYFATLFCPTPRRPALLALYAFNLEIATIGESVSEPMIGHIRLQWWRDALRAAFEGSPPGHPVAAALAEAVASCELGRAPFERMIEGRQADLDDGPRDLAAVEDYVAATSSSLVGLALAVLGARGPDSDRLARHAGLAWGLTGMLRAMPFRSTQWNSIPLSGISHDIANAARNHLDAARRLQPGLPRGALGAILPLACIQPYLERLSKSGGDPLDPRLERSRLSRQWRMTMAAARRRI